jgi:hypothetical protein
VVNSDASDSRCALSYMPSRCVLFHSCTRSWRLPSFPNLPSHGHQGRRNSGTSTADVYRRLSLPPCHTKIYHAHLGAKLSARAHVKNTGKGYSVTLPSRACVSATSTESRSKWM